MSAATELTIRHVELERTDAEFRHEQGWRRALDMLALWLHEEA